MDREETTIKGMFENNATFEYNIQINHRGLSFWGEIDEDRKEEYPTTFSIAFIHLISFRMLLICN